MTDVVCERPLPSLDHPSSLDHAAVLLVETRAVLYANEVEDQRTWRCEYLSDLGQTKSSSMYMFMRNYLGLTQGLVDWELRKRYNFCRGGTSCILVSLKCVGGFRTECI